MQPIYELLARIRHDPDFGQARFQIGYLDRVEGTICRVALREITFPEGERRMLELVNETGLARRIPFHRIREVCRDGELIWHRPA
jgi:uncharacterized protein (UPF0248 family)